MDRSFLANTIKFAFRAFDRDGAGFIDREEFKGSTQVMASFSSSNF